MLLSTTAAGACMVLGALAAVNLRRRPNWLENEFRHGVIAFGGGVLLAAVALVLLPQGSAALPDPWAISACFVGGGVVVYAIERQLGLRRRESPQFAAMLLDYVPESLALGGMFAAGVAQAPLLALLIGLQNLPEGFNAYRERLAVRGARPGPVLRQMALMTLLGPLLGTLSWWSLADRPALLGGIMLTAAGGILYLIFQDIAPMSRLQRHRAPPLGAVLGFCVALIGQRLVEG
jgi:ZIP family zinc transporter